MYEIYTLDFHKDHEALTKDLNGILWGSYEDIKFSAIKKYSSAEKLLQISENSTFEDLNITPSSVNVEQEIKLDSPSSMIVLYSVEEKASENDIELWKKENCVDKDFLSVLLISCDNSANKNIEDLVKKLQTIAKSLNVSCSCFGTFGMYNLCILIRTNKVDDIFSFVFSFQNEASNLKLPIKTSYTLVCYIGDDQRKFLDDTHTEEGKEKYVANIQITYADWSCGDSILSKFEEFYESKGLSFSEIKKYNVLGEYDLCLHIPARMLLLDLYREGGLLCSEEIFFKKNIQHCCTRLAKTIEMSKNYIENNIKKDDLDLPIDRQIHDTLRLLANNKSFKNNKALKRLFHILNIDFQKAYKLKGDKQLKVDLKYQFLLIIQCVHDAVEDVDRPLDNEINYDFYELISSLAHLFSKSVRNVIFTNELTINEPYTYLDTAALFPNVIYAYTGFIKKMFTLIYSNGGVLQSEIIPIVYIDSSINVPMSDLYMLDFSMNMLKKNDKTRIVAFKLPFDAVLNFESYIPLLIHEVSHFLCPQDREKRNKYLFKIIIKQYFSTMLYQIYDELVIDENVKEVIIPGKIREFVCIWIDKEIDILLETISLNNPDFFAYTSTYFTDFVCETFDSIFSKYKTSYENKYVGNIICEFYVRMINDWIVDSLEKAGREYDGKNNINKTSLQNIIIIKGKNTACCREACDFSNGIREIICDTVMIKCLSLQPETYFALVILSMLNQNITHCDEVVSIVRFGQIVNLYNFGLFNDFNILEYKELILNTIYHLNYKFYRSQRGAINAIINQISEAINQYKTIYCYFEEDISELINCYSIDSFNKVDSEIYSNDYILAEFRSLFSVFNKIKNIFIDYSNDKNYSDSEPDFNAKNNIQIMNSLQPQLCLAEIGEFYKVCRERKKKSMTKSDISYGRKYYTTESFQSYLKGNMNTDIRVIEDYGIEQAIKDVQELLTDDKHPEETLWYRGQNNANWPVSPAIFRRDSADFHKKLLYAYELFRAEACEALEIHTNINSNADWIACMQHYFVPTHFLDWSEQPLTSLYFALENYFENPCKYCDMSVPNCDNDNKNSSLCGSAALFVLNPHRMNRLLKNIEVVPNISIPYNENLYNNYILNYGYKSEGSFLIESTVDLIKCPPVAIITSQLNSRIRAQKGHFVAYDLRMNFNGGSGPNLVNLYELQKEYFIQCVTNGKNFEPFMAKIIIDYDMKPKLAHTLKAYGINKSSFYPELMHIGSDITKKVF